MSKYLTLSTSCQLNGFVRVLDLHVMFISEIPVDSTVLIDVASGSLTVFL